MKLLRRRERHGEKLGSSSWYLTTIDFIRVDGQGCAKVARHGTCGKANAKRTRLYRLECFTIDVEILLYRTIIERRNEMQSVARAILVIGYYNGIVHVGLHVIRASCKENMRHTCLLRLHRNGQRRGIIIPKGDESDVLAMLRSSKRNAFYIKTVAHGKGTEHAVVDLRTVGTVTPLPYSLSRNLKCGR